MQNLTPRGNFFLYPFLLSFSLSVFDPFFLFRVGNADVFKLFLIIYVRPGRYFFFPLSEGAKLFVRHFFVGESTMSERDF